MRMSLKIRLASEKFLSGFRKGDKLISVITAAVLLSDEEWKRAYGSLRYAGYERQNPASVYSELSAQSD